MKNNFLQLSILEKNNFGVPILWITLFSIFLLVIWVILKKYKRASVDVKRFIRFAFRGNVASGIICSVIILAIINVDDFAKIYDVKLVEKESISEIQYSKKNELKKRVINSLYLDIISQCTL